MGNPQDKPLCVVTGRAHYYFAMPDWDREKGLWLLIECMDGQFDGSLMPFPISRKHAAAMWPALKRWAESGDTFRDDGATTPEGCEDPDDRGGEVPGA